MFSKFKYTITYVNKIIIAVVEPFFETIEGRQQFSHLSRHLILNLKTDFEDNNQRIFAHYLFSIKIKYKHYENVPVSYIFHDNYLYAMYSFG